MVRRINGNYQPTPPSYTPDIATQVYTGYSWVIAGKKIPYKSLLITEEIAEVLCGRLFPLISNVVATSATAQLWLALARYLPVCENFGDTR
jgi:hypothetical protein